MSPQSTLTIRHIPDTDPPAFDVIRLSDGKAAGMFRVVTPVGFPVKDRPKSDLLHELKWYLEEFLNYPFPPDTDRAENVVEALEEWGRRAFEALFAAGQPTLWFHDAFQGGLENLRLIVSSDSPEVLSWPWETLFDKDGGGFLTQQCSLERRLNTQRDPYKLSGKLPTDRINILMITARPNRDQDVRFRTISRPFVELIASRNLPSYVDILRRLVSPPDTQPFGV